MSFGVVLTKITHCNIKDQCQEAYCRDLEGPRPLERSLRTDGAGDRVTEPTNYTKLSKKITASTDDLANLSPYNPVVREIMKDFKTNSHTS
jgi:hypothetical protein